MKLEILCVYKSGEREKEREREKEGGGGERERERESGNVMIWLDVHTYM